MNHAAPTVGRCGMQLPGFWGNSPSVICMLPACHPGWHRSDEGTEWGISESGIPEVTPASTAEQEAFLNGETRVVMIKPGDVLLIGGVRFGDAYQATETMDRFKELTGITPVVLFAGDIQLDTLTTDDLRELLARAEANAPGGVFCADEAEMYAALDAILPADAEEIQSEKPILYATTGPEVKPEKDHLHQETTQT